MFWIPSLKMLAMTPLPRKKCCWKKKVWGTKVFRGGGSTVCLREIKDKSFRFNVILYPFSIPMNSSWCNNLQNIWNYNGGIWKSGDCFRSFIPPKSQDIKMNRAIRIPPLPMSPLLIRGEGGGGAPLWMLDYSDSRRDTDWNNTKSRIYKYT